MAKIVLATEEQKKDYQERKPVYPLYGFIDCPLQGDDGKRRVKMTCAIEYVGDRDNEIIYEVMAPRGYHFAPEYVHSMFCSSRQNVREHVASSYLQACTDSCHG